MKRELKTGVQQWIRLGDLKPHRGAQRKFDKAHADAIAKQFDPAALGMITVARTKRGALWIIDGQHRHAAALAFLDGDENQELLCNVVDVDDDTDAGRLFLMLNNHKSVRTFDKFLVRLVAQETAAVAINSVLESHALRVGDGNTPGVVKAVDACESIYSRRGGVLMLDRVITILHNAWGDDKDAFNGQIMRGLSILLARHASIEDDELTRKLAKHATPSRLIGQARDYASVSRMSVAMAVAERMRNEYNKGRRVNRLEDQAAA